MKPVLVIQCGGAKREGSHPVWNLYTGSFWSTYRARRRETEGIIEGSHPRLDVYVLSAQFGLRKETDELPWYNCRLTDDRVETLAGEIRNQLRGGCRQLANRSIHFVGSKLYGLALERAGLRVVNVAPAGADMLGMRKALSIFLKQHRGLDLDALIASVQ